MIGQGGGFVNHLAEQRQIIDSPIHSAVEYKTGIVGKIRPNFPSPELSRFWGHEDLICVWVLLRPTFHFTCVSILPF